VNANEEKAFVFLLRIGDHAGAFVFFELALVRVPNLFEVVMAVAAEYQTVLFLAPVLESENDAVHLPVVGEVAFSLIQALAAMEVATISSS